MTNCYYSILAGGHTPAKGDHHSLRAEKAYTGLRAQHARDCMRLARKTARDYLNFGDGSLPNCLRMSFHDAATYTTKADVGGCAAPPRLFACQGQCTAHAHSSCAS